MATDKNLTYGTSTWNASETQDGKSKTYTFSTGGKYVDKDIAFTVNVQDGTGSLSGGAVTHGEITNTAGSSYLVSSSSTGVGPITFSNDASRGAVSYVPGTSGWVDSASDVTGLSATTTDTKTKSWYVKKGAASVTADQSITTTGSITADGGVLTATLSGSKTINGSATTAGWITSVSGASVSASGTATANATDLDANLIAANIVEGKTIFGVAGTATGSSIGGTATFSNSATAGTTYTDISSSAPVLKSGDYLYINPGYASAQKISLAKLVPDGASIATSTLKYLYKTESAYDNSGNLMAGTMDDAVITSGAPSLSSFTVNNYNTTNKNYPVSISASVAAPTVGTHGFTENGTFNTNSGTLTTSLTKAEFNLTGGGLTAGDGHSSITTNGYYNGSTVSATDKITLATTAASGYYKITTTGGGTVNRAAVSNSVKTAGYIKVGDYTNSIAADSASSNEGTTDYYIKKSTGSGQTWAPSKSAQSVTITAGYYPSDRTISVSAVDPTDSNQVAQGALSATDSAISSVSATAGTATVDTTNYKYNIPLTLSASGTAYAKVSTAGYVTTAKNTSKSLTGSGSATVSLTLYNGAYSVA